MTASFGLDIHCVSLPLAADEFSDILPLKDDFIRALLVVRVAPYLALEHPDDPVPSPLDEDALYQPWQWSSLEAAGCWSVWSVAGGAKQLRAIPIPYALAAEEKTFCQALQGHAPQWAEMMKQAKGFVVPFVARIEPRDASGDLDVHDPAWSSVHPERQGKYWCDALIGAASLPAPIPYADAMNVAACLLIEHGKDEADPFVAAPTFTVTLNGIVATLAPQPPTKPLDDDAKRWIVPLTLTLDNAVHAGYALVDPAEDPAKRYDLAAEDDTSNRVISPAEMWIGGNPAARAALEGTRPVAVTGGGGAEPGGYEPAAIGEAVVCVADLTAALETVDDSSVEMLDWRRAVMRDLAHSGMIGDRESPPPAIDLLQQIVEQETDTNRRAAVGAMAVRLAAILGEQERCWLLADGVERWASFLEHAFQDLAKARSTWDLATKARRSDSSTLAQTRQAYSEALRAISPSNKGMLAALIRAQWQEALYARDNAPRRFPLIAGTAADAIPLFVALDPTRKTPDDVEGTGRVGFRGVLDMRDAGEFRILVEVAAGDAGELHLSFGEGAFAALASPPVSRLTVKAMLGTGASVKVVLGGIETDIPLLPAAAKTLWIAFRWFGSVFAVAAGGSEAVGADHAAMTEMQLRPRGESVVIATAAAGALSLGVDTVTPAAALPTVEALDAVPVLSHMWRNPLARWLSGAFVEAVSKSTPNPIGALRDGAVAAAEAFVAGRSGGCTWGPTPGTALPSLVEWFKRQADIAFDRFMSRRAASLGTRIAAPIRLRIDQPAKATNDLWDDYAGAGVLVGRTAHGAQAPATWRSLCPATLQVGADGVSLGVPVLPRAVIEILGLRTFFIEYNNRLLSSRAEHDSDINTSENQLVTVRAADAGRWITPHLIFDTDQWFMLFVVGMGGALPSCLRDRHPARLKMAEHAGKVAVVADCAPPEMIQKVHYLRDVTIAAPGGQDKVSMRIQSRYAGKVKEMKVKLGDKVRKGSLLLVLEGGPVQVEVSDMGGFEEAKVTTVMIRAGDTIKPGQLLITIESDKKPLPFHPADAVSPLASELEDIGRRIEVGGPLHLFAMSATRGTLSIGNGQSLLLEIFDLSLASGDKLALILRGEPDPNDPHLSVVIMRAAATKVKVAAKSIEIETGPELRNVRILVEPHKPVNERLRVSFSENADLRRDGDMMWTDTGSTDDVDFQELRNGFLTIVNHRARAGLRIPRVAIDGVVVADALMSDALPETIVLGYVGSGSRTRFVSPPRAEFETLSRWLAAGLQDDATRENTQHALDKAFAARSLGAPDAKELQPDPAVSRYYIEGEIIHRLSSGAGIRGKTGCPVALRSSLAIHLSAAAASDRFEIRTTEQRMEVKVPEGCVAELCIYGAIDSAAVKRFEPEVVRAMRCETLDDGTQIWLGAPQRFWVESPLDIGLDTYRDAMLRALVAKPEVHDRRRRAAIGLEPDRSSSMARDRSLFRAVGRFYVVPQRWSWRGRQLPMLSLEKCEMLPARDPFSEWVLAIFQDRADDDHGPMVPGILKRQHLATDGAGRPLTSIDLGYSGSANMWRFGVELESRYRPLKPSDPNQRIRGAIAGKDRWLSHLVLADEVGAARPREILRPSVRSILPLTESLDFDGNVATAPLPPVMVQLDEGWSAGDNISEQLEVVVDIGIDPLKRDAEGKPISKEESGKGAEFRKMYQQVGGDVLLTATGHTGELIPLAVDGPLGFSFDTVAGGTSARRAAFLVSLVDVPALTHWKQLWPMARFSFRRVENPRLTAQAELTPIGKVYGFREDAEAIELIFDVPDAGETFRFTVIGLAGHAALFEVKVTFEDDGLRIEASLQGLRPFAARAEEKREQSGADEEQDGTGQGADRATLPRLRLAPSKILLSSTGVQLKVVFARQTGEKGAPLLHITPSFSDMHSLLAAQEQGGSAWRGGMSLPIDVAALGIDVSVPPTSALPMRCSPFVASSWVQFTPDTSRFLVELAGATPQVVVVESLKVELSGQVLKLRYARDPRTINRLMSVAEPDSGGVPRFRLFATVSHWVADAGGRSVEQHVEVVELNAAGATTLTRPVPAGGGRLRILSLMRTNDRVAQVPIASPEALSVLMFGSSPGIDETHLRVIGTSRPLPLSGK
ncbi:biotin/lipoyl-containing protein [Massilia niabensis]|uniref:Biotin/lipoyl-containing protein n=1 Tax=Massilia niabensis TaxID=544910 RepID=A0ABW0LAW1_9BURK